EGLLPAVIMNEVGDVNLDGLQVQEQVPMTEMLSGCICCSIRGDLSGEIAALYLPIDLRGIMTVVDSAHLLELYNVQKGKTYRLMQEQIRCASALILNKMDRVIEEEEGLLQSIVERWNGYAVVWKAVRCRVDIPALLDALGGVKADWTRAADNESKQASGELVPQNGREPNAEPHGPVESLAFERLIANLPRDVYRAKGVLTFSDTASRFLFQYAFRESDFMKITPQGNVPDVAVFIGEHFSRSELEQALLSLEQGGLKEYEIAMLRECIRLDRECADICDLAAQSMLRHSPFVTQICELCITACEACAEECSKHEHDHCQACAEACRRCAEACRQMLVAA
ncbi:hypothetical protein BGX30_001898, partial [Mortierella sp. GBA39]